MAETKIEWADYTFNPWIGCQKVAPGCTHCYAESFAKRYNKAAWGPNGTRVKTSEANWRLPLKWNRYAVDPVASAMRSDFPRRPRVFCASLADVFEDWHGEIRGANKGILHRCDRCHSDWPFKELHARGAECDRDCGGLCHSLTMDDLRRDLFALIDATPNLDWLLLTKRPENVRRMWQPPDPPIPEYSQGRSFYRPNVWLGTSVSDQATADKAIPELLKLRDLAPVLFLSIEPLLRPVRLTSSAIIPACGDHPDLEGYMVGRDDGESTLYPTRHEALQKSGIDWVIVGGESGPGARPCKLDWIRSIVSQCKTAGVPCFVKQLGSHPFDERAADEHLPSYAREAARKYGIGPLVAEVTEYKLRDRKGGDPDEWPADLRVREFPQCSLSGVPLP